VCHALLPLCCAVLCRAVPCCAVLQEKDCQDQGYMIKSGIVVIMRNATIKDGTTI
jgi:hypothetical protein